VPPQWQHDHSLLNALQVAHPGRQQINLYGFCGLEAADRLPVSKMAWGQAGSPMNSILQNPSDISLESNPDSEILFRFASQPGRRIANVAQKRAKKN
jgi:hypothetical protein